MNSHPRGRRVARSAGKIVPHRRPPLSFRRRPGIAFGLSVAALGGFVLSSCTAGMDVPAGSSPDSSVAAPTTPPGMDQTAVPTATVRASDNASPRPAATSSPSESPTGGTQKGGGVAPDAGVPVLTSATLVAGRVELSGYVAKVYVDGGECRFELVAGGMTTAATSMSQADATTTVCPGVSVTAPTGDPSSWIARLVWVPNGAVSESLPVTVGN